MPGTGRMGTAHVPGASSWTQAEMAAVKRRHVGIAIFHDGNPGHLWRGELASQLGEATLSAGIVMWIAVLLPSPLAVAAAVLALALPALFVRPFVARLENVREPRVPLVWIGRLRIVLALGLIAMHFQTIIPVLYALLLGISLLGRMREAVRTAVIRACLEQGEPAHVANDMHVGAAVAAVVGPLLATLFFILLGERILLVSIGAALFFLLSMNSEGFLDALPPERRAFLRVTPAAALAEGGATDLPPEPDDVGEDADPQRLRELGLPEWYQQGPKHAGHALVDLRAGLGLAGTRTASTAALVAVAALAMIGGGLAVLEVFYVTGELGLPTFYLGPLLAAEGTGAALGVALAGGGTGKRWRGLLIGGVVVSGLAVAALTRLPLMQLALGVALVLGMAEAFALAGVRQALSSGFSGVERRALAAAQVWVGALGGVVGAAAFGLFYSGGDANVMPLPAPLRGLPSWPIDVLLFQMGVALAVFGVALGFYSAGPQRKGKGKGKDKRAKADASGSRGRVPDELPDADELDGSRYFPAAGVGGWGDDEATGYTGEYGATGYQTGYYETGQYETGYQTGYGDATGYTGEYGATGYGTSYGRSARDDDDGYDNPGASRGGRGGGGRGRR